jgi:hypothetical protein
MNGFLFVHNMSKLGKSEPAYPHWHLNSDSDAGTKDMSLREKNIEPEIYREVKVTNNGWCVLDHDLLSGYRCNVTEKTHFPPAVESGFNEHFVQKL